MARRRRLGPKRETTIAFDLNKMEQEMRMAILQQGDDTIEQLAKKVRDAAIELAPELQPENMPDTYWGDHVRGPNKRNGDEKSGPLKESIFADASVKVPHSWIVCAPTWYAHFVEYGTQPHTVGVNKGRRPLGRFMAFPGTYNWSGTVVFANKVNHPGIKQKPFLRPAADRAEEFLNSILNP